MENLKHLEKMDITRTHDVTIEEVKALPMFANFTDEQAQEVVETIKEFVNIAMYCYFKEKAKQQPQDSQ